MFGTLLTAWLLLLPGCLSAPERNDTELYLLGLLGFSGAWPAGEATLIAAEMALEAVNSRPDILPGYRLTLLWNDTKCDPGMAVDVMYYALYRPPTKVMILGAGCSIASEPTARSSHLWNLVQVSPSSASPALSNKVAYPNFLRLTSPDSLINPAKVSLMANFGWSICATLHETFELFSTVTDDFVVRATTANKTVITSEIFTSDPGLQIRNLKKHDARIIFAGFYQGQALKVFCEAYREGLYGRRYVWIVPGFFGHGWWRERRAGVGCSPEEILQATEGHLEFNFAFLNPREERGVGNVTASEWKSEFDGRSQGRGKGRSVLAGTEEAPSAYDAIWAMALAMNATNADLLDSGQFGGLGDFTYNNSAIAHLLKRHLYNNTFLGVGGSVYFNENGDSPLPVVIRQQQEGTLRDVGYYFPEEGRLRLLTDTPIKWSGGSPPRDSTSYVTEDDFVTYTLYITMSCFGILGISLAGIFLAFNIRFRKNRLIKMSSPVMNNLILVGCVVTYCTVFLQELSPEHVPVLCKTKSLTVMVGFSLSFGSLFAKTWRVYRIFTNTTKKISVRDVQLVLIVFILVALDLIIFTLREVLDPEVVQVINISSEARENGDVMVVRRLHLCTSQNAVYFRGIIYVIKGLLLVFGAFLAWQTKKVTIPALNDSQYIGMCIYNVTVLSVLAVVIMFALDTQPSLQYVLTSGILLFGTTTTQLIIFVPKVLKLRKNRNQVEEDTSDTDTRTRIATISQVRATGESQATVPSTVEKQYVDRLLAELQQTKDELDSLKSRVQE